MGADMSRPDRCCFCIHRHRRRQRSGEFGTFADQHKCAECCSSFTPSVKQVQCKECDRYFCNVCTFQPDQCNKCIILLSGNFTRQLLQKWKVKDLKALLVRKNVNTSECQEKNDLIDLIFSCFGQVTNSQSETSQERHVDELVSNLRQEFSDYPRTADQREPNCNITIPAQEKQEPNINNIPPSSNLFVDMPWTDSAGQSLPKTQSFEEKTPDMQHDNSHLKLEDIKSEEQIEGLSIRSLKRVLLNNFVDFKGCCERWELQDRLKRLWRDHEHNKKKAEELRMTFDAMTSQAKQSSSNEDDICRICMDAAIDCVLLECGHMVSCTKCGKQLSECPICRQFVIRAVHIFKT